MIRSATFEDLPAIQTLIARMHAEGYPGRYSHIRASQYVADCWENGTIFVAVENNIIVGTLGLCVDEIPCSDDRQIGDRWFYVAPEHRRSRHASDLLTTAKTFSEEMGLPMLTGFFGTSRAAAKTRLYRKVFGEPIGAVFQVGT